MNGILLLDKPEGITSSDAINKIKKKFKIKKIGHSGTLDKFASGLLVIGINEGTKLLNYIIEKNKVYDTVFQLGQTTDTFDLTGNIQSINKSIIPDTKTVKDIVMGFIGEQYQIPPIYSAIKIGGERASDLARKGVEIDLSPRLITIYAIEIKAYEYPYLNLIVNCSKGTYIRAIARDIGEKLGCGACVRKLKRVMIPPYSLEDSVTLDELMDSNSLEKYIISLVDSIKFMPFINLDDRQKEMLEKGQSIPAKLTVSDKNFGALHKGKLFAILRLSRRDNSLYFSPERLFFDK